MPKQVQTCLHFRNVKYCQAFLKCYSDEQKNPVARDTDESTRDYQARRGRVARENAIRRTLNMISLAKGARLVDMENRRIIYRVGCRW